MLNQIDIYLHNADISTLYSDLGIKLHGFIMCYNRERKTRNRREGITQNSREGSPQTEGG